VHENRRGDVRSYITDNSLVTKVTGWEPKMGMETIVETTVDWIQENSEALMGVL
jgi:CDP-paratose 2-epimerase